MNRAFTCNFFQIFCAYHAINTLELSPTSELAHLPLFAAVCVRIRIFLGVTYVASHSLSHKIEHGYRGDMLDGMLLRFKILEEARSKWPAGMKSSQEYANWSSRQEL